jgi:hypothetical protein
MLNQQIYLHLQRAHSGYVKVTNIQYLLVIFPIDLVVLSILFLI